MSLNPNEHLEYLFSYNDIGKIKHIQNGQYEFPANTTSFLKSKKGMYKAKNAYIGPNLHKDGKSSHEIIIEHVNEKGDKCFLCKRLQSENKVSSFVSNISNYLNSFFSEYSFDDIINSSSKNTLYITDRDHDIIVMDEPFITNNVPLNTQSVSEMKQRVFRNDKMYPGINSKDERTILEKRNILLKNSTKEGFTTIVDTDTQIDTTGTYMQCELLQDDGEAYEDTAIVPLKTNTYERGLINFSNFLNYFLITVGAGFVLPMAFISMFSRETLMNNGTLNSVASFGSVGLFFGVGILLICYGTLNPTFSKKMRNEENMATGMLYAASGFYLVLLHLAFAFGMFSMKRLQVDERFVEMFDSQVLSGASFYNTLDGFKYS